MKNIYEPLEISHILAATIGTVKDVQALTGYEREEMLAARAQFIASVGKAVAAEVLEIRQDSHSCRFCRQYVEPQAHYAYF